MHDCRRGCTPVPPLRTPWTTNGKEVPWRVSYQYPGEKPPAQQSARASCRPEDLSDVVALKGRPPISKFRRRAPSGLPDSEESEEEL